VSTDEQPAGARRLLDLDELYRSARDEALAAGQKVRGMTETATDAKGNVRVSVSAEGAVTELTFLSKRYREMAPAQLSHLLLDTIEAARSRVQKRLSEQLTGALGGRLPVADLVAGTADLSALLPPELPAGLGLPGGLKPTER